jgi:membrane protein implicated in regulation of membrane protease activity
MRYWFQLVAFLLAAAALFVLAIDIVERVERDRDPLSPFKNGESVFFL